MAKYRRKDAQATGVQATEVGPGSGPPPEARFTAEKKREFLDLYASGVTTVRRCAQAVGVSARAVFYHARSDPQFAKLYEAAVQENTDHLEDYLGEHVLDKKHKGNLIALFGMLKARRPEKWREVQKVEHGGALVLMTADALAQARERAQKSDTERPGGMH